MNLEGIKCPACNNDVKLSFDIADEDKTTWIFCSCGTVFHQKELNKDYWQNTFINEYKGWKDLDGRYKYMEKVYLPLIEELTLGRYFLDIGFGVDNHIKNLRERGWNTNGIDIINNDYILGDFETHKFLDNKYDFIKLGNVIGIFKDPIKALYKVRELLNSNGLILLFAPDAELIYQKGMFNFGNWSPKENWIIFSERQIINILDKLGFSIIIQHKNINKRFMGWNYYHILAQKKD